MSHQLASMSFSPSNFKHVLAQKNKPTFSPHKQTTMTDQKEKTQIN